METALKKKKKYTMDMLHGPMWKKLIAFSLPIAATSILQQLFNSADVAVVGRFAGSDALAAVGANVASVGLFVNFLVGFSVGPNVLAARLIGQGRQEETGKVTGTTISLAAIMGILFLIIGQLITRPLLVWMGTPDNIMAQAELYFRVYLAGLPFMTIYNFGAAILRSIGDTRRPLYCLITSGVLNVILNLLFVIIFRMDVLGVALATAISNVVCSVMVVVILARTKESIRLKRENLKPEAVMVKTIVKEGLPAGFQSMLFSLSNLFVQAGINSFGSAAIAGSSAALNFEYFTYYMVAAFAQGTVTFTSQNYGAGFLDRCKKIFWITLWEGALFSGILCGIFVLFRNQVILVYTVDPEVIDFAIIRMMHVMALEFLTALYDVTCGALRGIGHSVVPSVLTVLGTVVFRIIWIYTLFAQVNTFANLMDIYPASWIFTSIMVIIAYIIFMRKLSRNTTETLYKKN